MVGLALGAASCAKDLDIGTIDPQANPEFVQNEVFVKQYALLALTGQRGPSGSQDLDGQDEGESGFYRTMFNCNELMTDECAWAWQGDAGIPEITFMRWNSSTIRVQWLYVRLGYNLTQMTYFLDQIEGLTDAESNRQRAEVRFLRALQYFHLLDLFGKAPFKEHFNNDLPVELSGKALYDYIQGELADCEADMADATPNAAEFGRANKAANWLLRARLYLNAEVYTGTPDWTNAKTYADKVINSGYGLSNDYKLVFMADNDQNAEAMKEIIFPIRQDGMRTRSYSGSTMLVCATRIGGMPNMGTTNGWSCIFARQSLVQKFFPDLSAVPMAQDGDTQDTPTSAVIAAAHDDRAMFYSGTGGGIRKLTTDRISGFTDGLSIVKWQNIRSDGAATNDVEYADTDIPLMRLAEAYLTRAEANFRLGDAGAAKDDVNELRRRANATEFNTNVTEQNLIDEWSREFYLEGRRRSDLVRFGMFTTNKYLWDWKGGTHEGQPVSSFYNRYPIPVSELNANPNMTQNPGY
jgi:hypothetical protein